METITVQRIDDLGTTREIVRLTPGQAMSFGRGSPTSPVDLRIPHPEVSRLAGQIRAVEDHWTVSNLSSSLTYVVENPEGGGEHVKIAPRRIGVPIPFEFSRLALPVSAGRAELVVVAPEHTFADPRHVVVDGAATVSPYSLDETAKYFAILVALCEPRLRDSSSSAIPTVPEIIARLTAMPAYAALSRTGVNFHIDYLAQKKLKLREFMDPDRTGRLEYKRAAVVGFAIRFDLVRDEHLRLLPPRTPTRA